LPDGCPTCQANLANSASYEDSRDTMAATLGFCSGGK
jgi:hypothetical protein